MTTQLQEDYRAIYPSWTKEMDEIEQTLYEFWANSVAFHNEIIRAQTGKELFGRWKPVINSVTKLQASVNVLDKSVTGYSKSLDKLFKHLDGKE